MDKETSDMVMVWLGKHRGDVDGLVRWMAYSLRLGSATDCRKLVKEAMATQVSSFPEMHPCSAASCLIFSAR